VFFVVRGGSPAVPTALTIDLEKRVIPAQAGIHRGRHCRSPAPLSFPPKRESTARAMDPRFRGGDVAGRRRATAPMRALPISTSPPTTTSFPPKRESTARAMDPRFRGGDAAGRRRATAPMRALPISTSPPTTTSFPPKRESTARAMDPHFRGGDAAGRRRITVCASPSRTNLSIQGSSIR
jgi:hypothetical protein